MSSQPGEEDVVLEMLLQLSSSSPSPWKLRFPYLDPSTVTSASTSVANIVSRDRTKLRKQLILFVRQLCSGSGTRLGEAHGSWIGRSLGMRQAVSSLLDVCFAVLTDDKDWAERDSEQQLAVAYAVLNTATCKPSPLHSEAGRMCVEIVRRILKTGHLTEIHHQFLAQVWECSAELPIDPKDLVLLAERSSLGLEQLLLWLGKTAVSGDLYRMQDALETSLVSTMIATCSQSPPVFQTVCRILLHMMTVSRGHCGVQDLTAALIEKLEIQCVRQGCDISSLYEEPCQLVAALLCIHPHLLPEQGTNMLSQEYILQMLHAIPQQKVALLLCHKPQWLSIFIKSET